MTWIIDFVAYKYKESAAVAAELYPLEICLLHIQSYKHTMYYIMYPCDYFNNLTNRRLIHEHNLSWHDGDVTFYSALTSIVNAVGKDDLIFVRDAEKAAFFGKWFNNIQVLEGATNVNFDCQNDVCARHNPVLRSCAKMHCVALYQYLYGDR